MISFIGAFLGILWVAGCAHALDNQLHENLLVASLGASAVLLYGVMESKLAQPRNVIGVGDISGIFVSTSHMPVLPSAQLTQLSCARIMQERQRLLYVTHPCIPALHIRLCQVIRGYLHCRCQQEGIGNIKADSQVWRQHDGN